MAEAADLVRAQRLAAGPRGDEAPHNLFFALRPNQETAALIADLIEALRWRDGFTGPEVTPERLHITLNPLGGHPRLPQGVIARACEAVSRVRMRPFVVALNRVVSFENAGRRRPLVLLGEDGVIGVHALYSAIHSAVADAGLARRSEPGLTPHLTLLRDSRAIAEEYIAPIRWQVREFVLIDSRYGESRHEILGRWRL